MIKKIMKRKRYLLPSEETIEVAKKTAKDAIERFEADMGYKLTANKLQEILGGDNRHWGRILKGAAVAKGPYLAGLEILKEHGIHANYILACAEKTNRYGHKNRNGNLVVHSANIFNDQQNFYENKVLERRLENVPFDDMDGFIYYRELDSFYSEGPHRPESFEEFLEMQMDFLESL